MYKKIVNRTYRKVQYTNYYIDSRTKTWRPVSSLHLMLMMQSPASKVLLAPCLSTMSSAFMAVRVYRTLGSTSTKPIDLGEVDSV